jgi:hypothetical protein
MVPLRVTYASPSPLHYRGECRCYQFVGGPSFSELFSSVRNLYYNEIRGGMLCGTGLAVACAVAV